MLSTPFDPDSTRLSPWMKPLTAEVREAVLRNVAQAPPLTDRQRERLRLLFMQQTDGKCKKTDGKPTSDHVSKSLMQDAK